MEYTAQRQTLIDSTPQDEMVDVKLESTCNTASMLSNVKIDLPDWCKNMMPGKPNTLSKKKLI